MAIASADKEALEAMAKSIPCCDVAEPGCRRLSMWRRTAGIATVDLPEAKAKVLYAVQ